MIEPTHGDLFQADAEMLATMAKGSRRGMMTADTTDHALAEAGV